MSEKQTIAGRVAYRVEGNYWVSYWAQPDTMEGALELGRIGMAFVQKKKYKRLFMSIIQAGLTDFFTSKGAKVDAIWKEERAPEHERSGRA